jgi:hypothetical protein
MLVFLTAIRHPATTVSFVDVERLFDRTIRSVCQQLDPGFRAVVVTNVAPRISFQDDRVTYHLVNFSPPPISRDGSITLSAMLHDKGIRLLSGALLARRFAPDHLALVDSDDLVSRRLSAYTNASPAAPGWYVDRGYVVDYERRRFQRKSGLVRYCGSSLIPNASALLELGKVADNLTEDSTPAELAEGTAPGFIDQIIGDHRSMVPLFARNGLRMRPVPFRSACWVRGTGHNYSESSRSVTGLPVTPTFCQEFGLDQAFASADSPSLLSQVTESVDCWKSRVGAAGYQLGRLLRRR